MNTRVNLITSNKNYTGPSSGYSTKKTKISLDNDPNFNIMEIVPFKVKGKTINFELRKKLWKVVKSGSNFLTIPIYEFSAFGIQQPDGSIYGN